MPHPKLNPGCTTDSMVSETLWLFRFALMACCWSAVPEERPRFSHLNVCLQDFYTTLSQFV